MIHLLMPHPGHHVDPATLSAALPFFRRVLRGPRRKPAVPAYDHEAGAATGLLAGRYACCAHCENGSPCEPRDNHLAPCEFGCNDPVLGDRMIADVRAEHDTRRAREHADAMHAGYARAVDRLRRDAGLPTIEEMRQEYFGLPQREPMRREPGKPPWFTMAHPVYGQAPQLEVEPELARRMIA